MAVFNKSFHLSRRCLQSLACLLVLAASQPALAEPAAPTEPAADADKAAAAARADQLAREGVEAAGKDDLKTARDKLAQAFKLKPAYDIAGNLGGVEYGLGRYREAAEHLSFSLRMYPDTGNPEQRAQTEKFLNEARAKVCAVTLEGAPAGASMLIDGSRSAALDQSRHYLDPGQHTLSLRAPGYEPLRKQYTCKAGDGAGLRMQMERVKASTPSKTGEDKGDLPLWPVLVGGGVALASAGLGTGMWFGHQGMEEDANALWRELPSTKYSCYNNNTTNCNDIEKLRRQERDFENTSIAAFVTGGVAALATVGYFIGYTLTNGSSDEGVDGAQSTSAQVHFTPSSVTLDVSF